MARCRKSPKRKQGCKTVYTTRVCRNGKIIRPKKRKVMKFTTCK